VDRSILSIPHLTDDGPGDEDAKDHRAVDGAITPGRPPDGAPNVLVILLDDVGFGAASVFGGPCRTPTAERLTGNGLSFPRFHTAALCARARQALLTGRHHHPVGTGAITEIATEAPGDTSVRPQAVARLAQALWLAGTGSHGCSGGGPHRSRAATGPRRTSTGGACGYRASGPPCPTV
jgi:arylsulfatase